MPNTQQNQTETTKIQGLLARYLELRSAEDRTLENHLDEDTINAFTEGRVSEREALPLVNHLSDCSFCRHKTMELVRLDLQFAEMDGPVAARETSEAPASISSVLSGILTRIFGSSEAAVFAHHEETDDEEDDQDPEKDGSEDEK
jgi:hypothetical protein